MPNGRQGFAVRAFTESIHCYSRAHCVACRDLEGGRAWRTEMARRFRVPGDDVDFDCPEGLPWNVKEHNLADGTQRHEKKPCGCGKKRPVTETAEVGASVPTVESPPPTRASCIECVEKHLGAACVLMSECRQGYPYRLRIIGHLHEAEDESQEWPELHAAIREARKAYQTTASRPDWEALYVMVCGIRRRLGQTSG